VFEKRRDLSWTEYNLSLAVLVTWHSTWAYLCRCPLGVFTGLWPDVDGIADGVYAVRRHM